MEKTVLLVVLNSVLIIINAAPLTDERNKEVVGEQGEHFEGDMLLTPAQREAINAAMLFDGDDSESRNGLRDGAKRWPNKTVVYHINEDDFDEEQVAKIQDALADIANKSCIKFRERKEEDEHAVIIKGTESGCFANVGYNIPSEGQAARQVLNLAKGSKHCFGHGTIIHEMLHTLGFYHMQSSHDRDDYVTIVWENVKAGHENNFRKYSENLVTTFGVLYDYNSVLHYRDDEFSKNGEKTIIPKQGTESGCFSNVGFNPESDEEDGEVHQVLNLGKRCIVHGTVVHEMLHTLGFYHMQSTYDRDDFVTIVWENIQAGHEHNFAKYNNDTVTDFGVPYDYGSVMHYPEKAFSKNGEKTILQKKEGAKIGQRIGLSEGDILKLNKMYCEDSEDVSDSNGTLCNRR